MFELVAKVHGDARVYARKQESLINKAMLTALKVEAFQVRKDSIHHLLKNGLHLEPLTVLEKKNGKKVRKRKPKSPLMNFARSIAYKVYAKELKAHIGFIKTKANARWRAKMIEQYSGPSKITYDAAMIEKLHKKGIHLRKDTVSAAVPVRDVIGAMLTITARDSGKNIQNNFYRKLAGERI